MPPTLDAVRELIEQSNATMQDFVARTDERFVELEARFNRESRFSAAAAAPDDRRDYDPVIPTQRAYDERKGQAIGSEAAGGVLVRDIVGTFFDRLRPQSVVLAAGPMIEVLDGPGDAVLLPGIRTSTTAAPTGENADADESEVVFGSVRIPLRKYAAYTVASVEWLTDASPGPRRILETDHRLQLATRVDHDMLQGNGTSIVGLRHWPGVNTTVLGGGSGAVPTLDDVLDAIGRLEASDAHPSAIFMAPRTWTQLRKERDAVNGRYQLQPDPTSESRRQLFGVPVFVSSQVSVSEGLLGSPDDDSSIIVADMSRVAVARKATVEILFDPYTHSRAGKVAIRSWVRMGLGVLEPAAVEVIAGALSV